MASTDLSAVSAAVEAADLCTAGVRCRNCERALLVTGADGTAVLRRLRLALEGEDWGVTATGLRLCPTCRTARPR
jgi:hypothetical protein